VEHIGCKGFYTLLEGHVNGGDAEVDAVKLSGIGKRL
jgi:hypothetical protein